MKTIEKYISYLEAQEYAYNVIVLNSGLRIVEVFGMHLAIELENGSYKTVTNEK
jgi:hypothetical protein